MTVTVELGDDRLVSQEGVREPHLFKLQSGDLLLTYHVQADMHFAERHGMRSSDGGRTWRAEPRRAHREQAMGQSADGLTVLAPDIYTFEKEQGAYISTFFESKDGGVSFEGPFESIVNVDRIAGKPYPRPGQYPPDSHPLRAFFQPLPEYYQPIAEKTDFVTGPTFWRYLVQVDGKWLAAMQCLFYGDTFYRTILVESTDEGRSWIFVTTIARFMDGVPGDGFCEPALARVADGSLLCIMRRGAHLGLAQCRSTDAGATWSEPEILAGHGVDPDLFLMSNNILACTFGRPGLHIMFSEDGCGYSWGYREQIGDWRSSTYMGIAEVEPDKLFLVYDRRSDEDGKHKRDPDACHIGGLELTVRREPNA